MVPRVKDFERLLRLWKKFYILDDVFYLKIIRELNLDINPAKAYAYLIRFLELWGVRRAAVNILPEELSSKIRDIRSELAKLSLDILEADLEELNPIIKHVFQHISSVKGVGATSASKILHLLKPKFFIMWDREIAEKYGVEMCSSGYVEFLKKCQFILKKLLTEYRKLGIEKPESWLTEKYGKPLTKLLDEYNWLSTRPWLNRILNLTL